MWLTWFASLRTSDIYTFGYTISDSFCMDQWLTQAATLFVSLAILVFILEGIF